MATLTEEIARDHSEHCEIIDESSSESLSGLLGPDSVIRTPKEDACRDLDKSNRSTPIHANNAQLSGPAIPGVHISDAGNLVRIEISAFSSIPVNLAN
jgi:hypothetical protein